MVRVIPSFAPYCAEGNATVHKVRVTPSIALYWAAGDAVVFAVSVATGLQSE